MRCIHVAGILALFLAGCGPRPSSSSNPPTGTSTPLATDTVPDAVERIKKETERVKESNDLKQFALAYHSYWDANAGKGPTKLDDLYPYMVQVGGNWPTSKAMASGKYKLYMNATPENLMTTGFSETVLAYSEDAPIVGGMVVMADGSVRIMTADEFNKAPQAGK